MSVGQANSVSAMLVASGKLFNDAKGLIWPTEGCFFAPTGEALRATCGRLDHCVARALPANAKADKWFNIIEMCSNRRCADVPVQADVARVISKVAISPSQSAASSVNGFELRSLADQPNPAIMVSSCAR